MAVRFDTRNTDWFSRTSGSVLDYNTPYTAMFWYYNTRSSGNFELIWYVTNSVEDSYDGIGLDNADPPLMRLEAYLTPSTADTQTGSAMSIGAWHHVAVRRNGSPGTLEALLNGTSAVTCSGNVSGRGAAAKEFVGALNGAFGCVGRMMAFKAWQTALTDEEIRAERWAIRPLRRDCLVWRPMVYDTASANARDLISGYDLTAQGTPTVEDGPPVSWGASPIIVPFASPSVGPTLSLPGVNSITSTSAIPKVTLTF